MTRDMYACITDNLPFFFLLLALIYFIHDKENIRKLKEKSFFFFPFKWLSLAVYADIMCILVQCVRSAWRQIHHLFISFFNQVRKRFFQDFLNWNRVTFFILWKLPDKNPIFPFLFSDFFISFRFLSLSYYKMEPMSFDWLDNDNDILDSLVQLASLPNQPISPDNVSHINTNNDILHYLNQQANTQQQHNMNSTSSGSFLMQGGFAFEPSVTHNLPSRQQEMSPPLEHHPK